MTNDEKAIHELIAAWEKATVEGDLKTVLDLMADDVVFLTVGQPPMQGKDFFAKLSEANRGKFRIHPRGETKEVAVHGNWAYCWRHLSVTMIPPEGPVAQRSGHTLSVLRKKPDGTWVIARDANLLVPETGS